jgi:hypothetical protein
MKTNCLRAKRHKTRRVFANSAVFATICVFFGVTGAHAQSPAANANASSHESERAAQVRALNNSVLQLHGQVQRDSSAAASLANDAAGVLAQRAAALQSLIQENPRAALSFAFSPELLADLSAKFPNSAAQLESHATLSGPVQRWTADYPGLKTSRSGLTMKVGATNLNLQFAYREPPALKSGDVIHVVGVVAGSAMAVETSSIVQSDAAPSTSAPTSATLAATNFVREERGPISALLLYIFVLAALRLFIGSHTFLAQFRRYAVCAISFAMVALNPTTTSAQTSSCSTTGAQKIAVILVTFPGVTLPANVTPQSLTNIFFGSSTGVSLDGYLREASYGQTSAAGSVFGPYTLSGSYSSCSDVGGAVLNDAIAAAVGNGANLGNYNRVVLVFPDVFSCGWAGFADVGGCSMTTSSGTFNATASYLSVSYLSGNLYDAVDLVSHEIGHNLGLQHSGTINSGTDVLGPINSPGSETDSGDYWSVMGERVPGLYPAPQKAEILDWIKPTTNYQVVQSSGVYTLQPFEVISAGLQAIKVQRGTGNNEWLWIEYRQPLGKYDAYLSPASVFSGALVHYEDSTTAIGHTYVANFTPNISPSSSSYSPQLNLGQTWTDPYSNLSLSVLSAVSSGLTVNVNYGATPCTAAAPTVSVSPLNPSVYPGQTASYSATVTNNDSSGCSSNTITLGSSEPSGWSTSLSSSSMTLNPGQSAALTLGKGAPSGTPAGTYAVNLNASTSAATGAATPNATVVTPPTLAVSTSVSGSSFVPPSTVSITASVTNGGTSALGAAVTFTVTAPNGSSATQSASTGSNGIAAWNYKLNVKSPAGTYSVSAQAALSSGSRKTASTQSVTSNTVSFTVQ